MTNIAEKAKIFAIKAHGSQKYGKMPYEYHLQKVVDNLLMWRDFNSFEITDEHLAVAWLHDVLEDTETTLDEINDLFGVNIGLAVLRLSKLGGEVLHYNGYIRSLKANPIARIVKLSDTKANLEACLLSGQEKRAAKYARQLNLLLEDLE